MNRNLSSARYGYIENSAQGLAIEILDLLAQNHSKIF